ncbi:hypothetical protein TYRP_013943 [Tyrophagus putrescentiae]|nr:hypothetical protein TYRP_013943 [Tyrophagus putrescentiae]
MHNSQMTPVQFASVNEFLWLMASTRDFQTPDDLLRRIYKLVHQAPKVPVTIQFGSREPLVSRKTLDRTSHWAKGTQVTSPRSSAKGVAVTSTSTTSSSAMVATEGPSCKRSAKRSGSKWTTKGQATR